MADEPDPARPDRRRASSWFPYPTRLAGAALLLAAVVPLVLGSVEAFVAANVVVVGLVLTDWAIATPPSRFRITRFSPGVVALGSDGARMGWRLANPTGRRQVVHLSDDLAPSLRAGSRFVTAMLPAHREVDASTPIDPARRGRFVLDRLALRVEGPLRLAARQRWFSQPELLRIYPAFPSRKEAELRVDRARTLEIGLRTARSRGAGTEFDQLREYTVDDEFGRVDWAATARLGKPIVRTYRAERNQTVICLLDNGRIMAGRIGGVPRVEHAMDAVLAVTTVSTRLGDRAGLVAFDGEVRAVVPPAHHRGQLSQVTEAMYDLPLSLVESDYLGAFAETLARMRRRALLVVLTELVDQAVQESLLPAMPLIARNHLVLVGAVRDPEVVAWSRERPEDALDTYRQAAALRALAERDVSIARLRAYGATVIDAPPGQLAPRLADAYLKVKAVGRL